MSTDPGRPYQIVLLHSARTQIKQCAAGAARLGIAAAYAATFRAIHENLSAAPLSWGDPIQSFQPVLGHPLESAS